MEFQEDGIINRHPGLKPEIVIAGCPPDLFGLSIRDITGALADVFGMMSHIASVSNEIYLQHGDARLEDKISSCVRLSGIPYILQPDFVCPTGF